MKKKIQGTDADLTIPRKVLEEAGIERKEVILEMREGEIRIFPGKIIEFKKPLSRNSPIWNSVGIGETDFNGRDHDAGIYE
jgi:hypothetical protein